MTTLTLTLTLEQAYALTSQLDLAVRIHLCQFKKIEHLARFGALKHNSGRELTKLETGMIDAATFRMSDACGFSPNSSFGIGSHHVSNDAHRSWEIKKVVEQALAIHRDPNPAGIRGVNYDGLIVRYTTDPAPVAKIEDIE